MFLRNEVLHCPTLKCYGYSNSNKILREMEYCPYCGTELEYRPEKIYFKIKGEVAIEEGRIEFQELIELIRKEL